MRFQPYRYGHFKGGGMLGEINIPFRVWIVKATSMVKKSEWKPFGSWIKSSFLLQESPRERIPKEKYIYYLV